MSVGFLAFFLIVAMGLFAVATGQAIAIRQRREAVVYASAFILLFALFLALRFGLLGDPS